MVNILEIPMVNILDIPPTNVRETFCNISYPPIEFVNQIIAKQLDDIFGAYDKGCIKSLMVHLPFTALVSVLLNIEPKLNLDYVINQVATQESRPQLYYDRKNHKWDITWFHCSSDDFRYIVVGDWYDYIHPTTYQADLYKYNEDNIQVFVECF